jgi:hypothetical protein
MQCWGEMYDVGMGRDVGLCAERGPDRLQFASAVLGGTHTEPATALRGLASLAFEQR